MWLHAGDEADLSEDTPLPITLRVARPDGPSEVVDRKSCTSSRPAARFARSIRHARTSGCRTRFNPETKRIECPCHGGVYDVNGTVLWVRRPRRFAP